MSDSFEVAHSGAEGELSEEQRHEVVAAQLRGEQKAAGQGPEAVVAAVTAELEAIGVTPDPSELRRRYEKMDPDIPELTDADDLPPAERGTGATTAADASGTEGPVSAGVDATSTLHTPVDTGAADTAAADDAARSDDDHRSR